MDMLPHPLYDSPPLGEKIVIGFWMVKGASLTSVRVTLSELHILTRQLVDGVFGTGQLYDPLLDIPVMMFVHVLPPLVE